MEEAGVESVKSKKKQGKHLFKKGESGNPGGREKGTTSAYTLNDLRKAITHVEKERKVSFIQHFVNRAMDDDRVLIAFMKKMIPDKLEGAFEGGVVVNIIPQGAKSEAKR